MKSIHHTNLFIRSIILTSLLILLYSCSNNTNIFSFSPSNTIELKGSKSSNDPITGTIYIKSNSGTDIRFRWKKISDNSPKEWHVSFCDNVTCYLMMPDSSDLRPINSSMHQNDNRMKLYIEPNNLSGTATIKIVLFDPISPSFTDTLIYHVNIE